jgi:hypothetical protein
LVASLKALAGYRVPRPAFILACTTQSAATSVRRTGIEFPSTAADMPDRHRLYQTCSTYVRRCKPKGRLFAATSHTAGSGYVGRMARGLAQHRVPAQWWEFRSRSSDSCSALKGNKTSISRGGESHVNCFTCTNLLPWAHHRAHAGALLKKKAHAAHACAKLRLS